MRLRSIFILSCFLFVFASCGSRKGSVLQSSTHRIGGHIPSTTRPSERSTANSAKPQGSGAGWDYIEQYKDIAISEMNRYGIPASIKLAQALLESGNGNSFLAQEANNHFGIKCGGTWSGPSVARPDDGPNDCFRVYRTAAESFSDHSQFLLRKRYENLFRLSKNDYKGWARGLKEAGYATNPRYPELLIDLIERYDLQQYDRAESYVEKEVREEKVEEIIAEKKPEEAVVVPEEIKKPVAMQIYEVKRGDTLFSIAAKVGLTQAEILEINGLSDSNVQVGQLLIVSK